MGRSLTDEHVEFPLGAALVLSELGLQFRSVAYLRLWLLCNVPRKEGLAS